MVKAAPQARLKTTRRGCICAKAYGTIDLIAVTLMPVDLLTRAWDDASTFKRVSRSLAETGIYFEFFFGVFFEMFLGCFLGAQKGPKSVPKRVQNR